ncbi:MAG: DNA polymerase III subunit delta [Gammaproteobacteria bacterium]
MQIRIEQLESCLKRDLKPVYLVCGDVPLLVQEASDQIRQATRKQGFSERIVMHVEARFNWNELSSVASGLSLFCERRLLELRLPTGKPGDAGSKAVQAYLNENSDQDVLLIIAGKIEAASRRTKWYKLIEKLGVVVQVWPLDNRQLPVWVQQRMRKKGMEPTAEAIAVLANRVEGNLLACAQEIEKLHLINGPGSISLETVMGTVADSARYDVFDLIDSALAGDTRRTVRIIKGLRSEGAEPVVVLWALAREIRSQAKMATEVSCGSSVDQVLARFHVWEKRKTLVKQGLRRHRPARWWAMLRRACVIDRNIKGFAQGNVWDELLQLSLMIAGKKLMSAA